MPSETKYRYFASEGNASAQYRWDGERMEARVPGHIWSGSYVGELTPDYPRLFEISESEADRIQRGEVSGPDAQPLTCEAAFKQNLPVPSKDRFAYFRRNGEDIIWKVKRDPKGDGLHVGTAYFARVSDMDWMREHCPVGIEMYPPVSEAEVCALEEHAASTECVGIKYPQPVVWTSEELKELKALATKPPEKFRPAPMPDDDEIPIFDASHNYRYFRSGDTLWRVPPARNIPPQWFSRQLNAWKSNGTTAEDVERWCAPCYDVVANELVERWGGAQVKPETPAEPESRSATVPAPPPVGDPATEAFYRDRLAAADRCALGVPNPADKADHDARVVRMTTEEHSAWRRERDLEKMAKIESKYKYPLQDSPEYRSLIGWSDGGRNGTI